MATVRVERDIGHMPATRAAPDLDRREDHGRLLPEALRARVLLIGRLFFAVGLIALGVEHFVFREFITGRAPRWPESIPGGAIAAYLSGAVMIAAGIAIVTRTRARLAAVVAGILILLWAFVRHVPVVMSDALLAPTWTHAGKALTLLGGAFAVAATLPIEKGNGLLQRFANRYGEFITLGRIALGLFLLLTGMQHFKYTPFVASLIPPWFPGDAVFWTRFAGVALIAGGIGLLVRRTAPLAALLAGLMVFSWFWIVHIPRTFASVSDGIAVFEALAVSGIAFVLAASIDRDTVRGPSGS